MTFDTGSLEADRVRDESGYGGLRLNGYATIEGARLRIVIDIGIDDAKLEVQPFRRIIAESNRIIRVNMNVGVTLEARRDSKLLERVANGALVVCQIDSVDQSLQLRIQCKFIPVFFLLLLQVSARCDLPRRTGITMLSVFSFDGSFRVTRRNSTLGLSLARVQASAALPSCRRTGNSHLPYWPMVRTGTGRGL